MPDTTPTPRPADTDTDAVCIGWLHQVYATDIRGGSGEADIAGAVQALPRVRRLADRAPAVAAAIAWATGDVTAIDALLAADPDAARRVSGPLALPPIIAVTHSVLVRHPDFGDGLRAALQRLLAAGADPDSTVGNRGWPAALEQPDERMPLSALYGAAGRNHDPRMTALLLTAGADPDDGESLYHALESRDCTQRLLAAGARIDGTNAMYRIADLDDLDVLRLLLAAGGNPNEAASSAPTNHLGTPLLWAVHRDCSVAHIAALLEAGADPTRRSADGFTAHRLAVRRGRPDIADALRRHGAADDGTTRDRFIGAVLSGADDAVIRQALDDEPGLVAGLDDADARLLPEAAAAGRFDAVRRMVDLGWRLETVGGDWSASALNLAIFRGDAAMADWLLARGALWTTRHGHGGDALGTLSWASRNRPTTDGDWAGCAAALRRHGLAAGTPDPARPGWVRIGAGSQPYPPAIAAILVAPPATSSSLDRVRADLAARAPDLRIEIAATSTATVLLAADAFSVTPGRIAKSLALRAGDRAVLVVTSGDRRLDNRKLRQAFGTKVRMLDAAQTFAVTGHPVGGVCPFALTTDLPVYCDRSLQDHDEVLPAAGSLTSAVRISPQRLAALTGDRWIDVCQAPTESPPVAD